MKILIVDTFYAPFLRAHYAAHAGLEAEPYATQWRSLMDEFFSTADSYSHYLAPLGHEAHELVVNCDELQAAWAREHGFHPARLSRLAAAEQLVEAQARAFAPDVVYVQNMGYPTPRLLRRLRRRAHLVGQIASELPSPEHVATFDLVLTSFPHFVEQLDLLGTRGRYFRLGFDPRVLQRLAPAAPSEVVFVGSLGAEQHTRGNAVLEQVATRLPLAVWGHALEERGPGSALRARLRGEAWGLAMFEILAGSRIALNRHIDVAGEFANNLRLYEATGVGTLLLTDEKRNLGELFEVGREVVTYRDADELVAKARHYLEHDDERHAIAAAGQARTLREHTYEHRMIELSAILEEAA